MSANFTTMGYDSIAIANAIRYAAYQKNKNVNMTQINKLLYIIYGTILVKNKQRITDESPRAWPYGPVFPRVHNSVKLSDNITSDDYESIEMKDVNIIEIINKVVDEFGDLTAGQLSEWSHQDDSPWRIAVDNSNGKWNTKLNDEDIFNYFFSFIKSN